VRSDGTLRAIARAAAQARVEAISLNHAGASCGERARLVASQAQQASNGMYGLTRWTHLESALLERFVRCCGARTADAQADALALESAANQARERQRHWDTLRRGLLRRATRRATWRA
jgi:hypothetical protein